MGKASPTVPAARLALYETLVATNPKVERKGAAMPYTSLNGHMFSFLTQTGTLALRLPADEELKGDAPLKRDKEERDKEVRPLYRPSTKRCVPFTALYRPSPLPPTLYRQRPALFSVPLSSPPLSSPATPVRSGRGAGLGNPVISRFHCAISPRTICIAGLVAS
jgi:hypothetical protein